MKRALSLILALVMCLSLCACNGGETENTNPDGTTPQASNPETSTPEASIPETTAPIVIKNKVGDTVNTDLFNCTLTRAGFANQACAITNETYLLPCEEHYHERNPHTAEDGYKLLCFTFELTYSGTTEYKFWLGGRESMDFVVKYDNAYEFDSFVVSASTNPAGYWESAYELASGTRMGVLSNPAFKFAPLEEKVHEFRVYIQVPDQVAENMDKPVDIIISLCEEDVVFSVR